MPFAQDKIFEASYHLGRAEEDAKRWAQREGAAVQRFRYSFSAFVSSARSATFALHKEFCGRPGFDEWYTEVQQRLRDDPDAKRFRTLRNIIEKEGNRLPLFVLRFSASDGTSREI